MKRILQIITLLALALSQLSFASGLFFNVSAAPGQLNITTTIPNHFYPAAGILITSPGYSLKNPGTECTFARNGYCLFPVSDTSPAHISINGAAGTVNFILCLNGTGPLSCQNYSASNPSPEPTPTPHFAYIGTTDGAINTLRLCTINLTTNELTNCMPTGSFTTPPTDIAFSPDGSRAYVSNFSSSTNVSLCNVNTTTGVLSGCVDTGVPNGFDSGIALNPAGTFIYISRFFTFSPGDITKCAVNPTTGALSGCVELTDNLFNHPMKVTFNSAGTLAYVPNYSTIMDVCTVNPDGSFSSCTATALNITPNAPGIALNSSETIAYVTAGGAVHGDNVYRCNITPVTGALIGCVVTGSGFAGPVNIALSPIGPFAYITNEENNTISKCAINATTGNLGSCAVTGPSVSQPFGIVTQ